MRAKSNFKAEKVEYIPGIGIDLTKYNSVEVDRDLKRSELLLPLDSFVVLSIGELNRNKNHEVVIKAIAKINNTDIHYVICGEGPLNGYLKNLSKNLGIENQVHLLGYRKDIDEICKASDIFVFPSLREGLGMAALEAMACGLPIITSNVHGIVDYSINGENGYNCSPLDINSISNGIEKLCGNTELISKFSKKNEQVIQNFTFEKTSEIIMRIYCL